MIYTLNTRSNVQLEVVRDLFDMDSQDMFCLINKECDEMVSILESKGILYEKLRGVLTPPHKSNRKEFVFCFDSEKVKSSWYGNVIMKEILPLINKQRNHAILQGDFCVPIEYNEVAFYCLKETLILSDELTSGYCGQYFLVYINNLTQEEIDILLKGLVLFKGFVGYADMTYSNSLKDIIAYYLGQSCLQLKQKMLLFHEDDRSNEEDVNLIGYPYKEYGFEYQSIQEYYYSFFLEYKIESRRVDKSDLLFSLNAISNRPEPFDDYEILVDSSKFEYIKKKNVSSIEASGIDKMTEDGFKEFLQEQIKYSYLYNLEINKFNIAKFNTIIQKKTSENKVIRFLASFEYKGSETQLRLLNFF